MDNQDYLDNDEYFQMQISIMKFISLYPFIGPYVNEKIGIVIHDNYWDDYLDSLVDYGFATFYSNNKEVVLKKYNIINLGEINNVKLDVVCIIADGINKEDIDRCLKMVDDNNDNKYIAYNYNDTMIYRELSVKDKTTEIVDMIKNSVYDSLELNTMMYCTQKINTEAIHYSISLIVSDGFLLKRYLDKSRKYKIDISFSKLKNRQYSYLPYLICQLLFDEYGEDKLENMKSYFFKQPICINCQNTKMRNITLGDDYDSEYEPFETTAIGIYGIKLKAIDEYFVMRDGLLSIGNKDTFSNINIK